MLLSLITFFCNRIPKNTYFLLFLMFLVFNFIAIVRTFAPLYKLENISRRNVIAHHESQRKAVFSDQYSFPFRRYDWQASVQTLHLDLKYLLCVTCLFWFCIFVSNPHHPILVQLKTFHVFFVSSSLFTVSCKSTISLKLLHFCQTKTLMPSVLHKCNVAHQHKLAYNFSGGTYGFIKEVCNTAYFGIDMIPSKYWAILLIMIQHFLLFIF